MRIKSHISPQEMLDFRKKAIFTAFYRYFNIVLLDVSQKIYKFARKVYNYSLKIYGKFESS